MFAAAGKGEGSNGGLAGGELDITFISTFANPRLSFLADVSLGGERREASDSGPGDFDAALERATLRYEHSDLLRLSAGQHHTPLSRWSSAYHRARWLHVAASRPRMVEFDDSFLPTHFLGAMAEGTSWAGGWNLSYSLGLGDGRPGLTTADHADDLASDGAALLALAIEPVRLGGFRAGAAVYADRLTLEATGSEVDETIFSAHLAWSRGINQIIGEITSIRHRDAVTGKRYSSEGFYLEIAYRLPFFRRRMALYNRAEELRIEPGDPVLTRTVGSRVNLIGVHFDFRERIALKAEIRQISARNTRDKFVLFLQTSMTF